MSPISSSRLLVGRKARSAALRTISTPPRGTPTSAPPTLPTRVSHSTRSTGRTPPSARDEYNRPLCASATGTDIVTLAVRVGKLLQRGIARRVRRTSCRPHERLWQRSAQRTRSCRHLPSGSPQGEFPRQAGDRARRALHVGGAQRRCAHDPQYRGDTRLLLLHEHLSKTGREQATCLDREHRPGKVATSPPVQTEEVNPPGGGETAFVNTWALGALAPHASRFFIWHVTPVKAGVHTVHYTVAAGLDGKSLARLAGGGLATGSLIASIAPAPPRTHVNPETGEVEAGPHPAFVKEQPASE